MTASGDHRDDAGRLYVATGRILRALRRETPQAPFGHGALSALTTLVRDGPMRLGELADREAVAPPSMTRIVAFLEQSGYVAREPDPGDRRACLAVATDAGRELVTEGWSVRVASLRARVARLDAAQRRALRAALPALEALARDDE